MSEKFDPYHEWLGIPASEQPPHHYRLLGIPPFETSTTVIENAANQRMTHLRTFQTGKHAAESQRLLNELAAARVCLLKPEKKNAYDHWLREKLAAYGGAPEAHRPILSLQTLPQFSTRRSRRPRKSPRRAGRRKPQPSSRAIIVVAAFIATAVGFAVWVAFRHDSRRSDGRLAKDGGQQRRPDL